jgi:hypothetical protein
VINEGDHQQSYVTLGKPSKDTSLAIISDRSATRLSPVSLRPVQAGTVGDFSMQISIDEITSRARGAVEIDPALYHFEIGQDSGTSLSRIPILDFE